MEIDPLLPRARAHQARIATTSKEHVAFPPNSDSRGLRDGAARPSGYGGGRSAAPVPSDLGVREAATRGEVGGP